MGTVIWEIASYGDVITLLQIFNAISVIFQNGGYQSAAIAISIFVVIGMAVTNLVGGAKETGLTKVFAGFIVFAFGFGTLTSVSIENRYDGTETQIDNIPVAVAVPASLISSVGLWITEKSEIAFSNTGSQRITTDGYLSPLKVIANLRRATYADSCPSGMSASSNTYNLCYSLRNYMADCAAVKANRDNQSLEMQKDYIVTAMQFNSNAFSTELIKADKSIESLSCSAAYTKIVSELGVTETSRLNALGGVLGTRAGETGIDKIKSAMEAIAADSSKATNFANSIYLAQPAEGGTVDYFMKIGAADIAENYSTSIQQRNYEWSLQADMFLSIMDKALSIFEAVMYAIAPFIGLMILTGSAGMKTLLLYCQMLLVIQFMPPMLVVVQNIILADMAAYEKSLIAQGMVIGSLDYMISLTKKANELMGMGGMMATTIVPALAMSLATGSGMAMMGAMRGLAAPPKDTDAVPNSATQGGTQDFGKLNNSALNRYGDAWTESNKDSVVGVASASDWKSQIDEKHSRASAAERSYQETRSEVAQAMSDRKFTSSQIASMSAAQASSTTDASEWVSSASTSFTDTGQISESNAKMLAGHVGLAARLGLDFANVNGEIKEMFTDGLTSNEVQALQKMYDTGEIDKLQQSFKDEVIAESTESKSLSVNDSVIDGIVGKADDAYKEANTAKEEYSQSISTMRGIKAEDSDLEGIYHRLGRDSSMQQEHDRLYDSLNDIEREQYAASMEELSIRMDDDTAKMVALSSTLKDANRSDDFFDAVTKSGVFSTPEIDINELDNRSGNSHLDTSSSKVRTSEPSTTIEGNVPTKAAVEQFAEENRAIVRQNQEAQERNLPEQGKALQQENAAIIQKGGDDIAAKSDFSFLNLDQNKEDLEKYYDEIKSFFADEGNSDTSQPKTKEQVVEDANRDIDEQIAYHEKMIDQNSKPLSDHYLSDDTKEFYRQNIAEHMELKDKLEAEKTKLNSGESYTTSVELDSDQEWYADRKELSKQLEWAERVSEALEQETSTIEQTETAKNNFNEFKDLNDKEISFLKQQIDNIDNNLPYQLESGSPEKQHGMNATSQIPMTEEADVNQSAPNLPNSVNVDQVKQHYSYLSQKENSASTDLERSFYAANLSALENGNPYSVDRFSGTQYVNDKGFNIDGSSPTTTATSDINKQQVMVNDTKLADHYDQLSQYAQQSPDGSAQQQFYRQQMENIENDQPYRLSTIENSQQYVSQYRSDSIPQQVAKNNDDASLNAGQANAKPVEVEPNNNQREVSSEAQKPVADENRGSMFNKGTSNTSGMNNGEPQELGDQQSNDTIQIANDSLLERHQSQLEIKIDRTPESSPSNAFYGKQLENLTQHKPYALSQDEGSQKYVSKYAS